MRVLRAQNRKAMPWKNGGGTTSEIAVYPPDAGLDDFGWRISIAEVRTGGPFSIFPQIDRRIAILKGSMALTIDGKAPVTLSPQTSPLAFPGDAATSAELVESPVTDLNVMTRRGVFTSRMEHKKISGTLAFDARCTTFMLLRGTANLDAGGEKFSLSDGDVLLIERGVASSVSLAAEADVFWIEIDKTGL